MAILNAVLIVSLAVVVFGRPGPECAQTDQPICTQALDSTNRKNCYNQITISSCCNACGRLVDAALPKDCPYGDQSDGFQLGGFRSCEKVKDNCSLCNRQLGQQNCCGSCYKYCKTPEKDAYKRFLTILEDTLAMMK